MAKYPTYPVLLDQLLSFSISDLNKKGLIKSDRDVIDTLKWTSTSPFNSGLEVGSVGIRIFTRYGFNYIELSYQVDGVEYKYRIEIVQLPSNLGRGKVNYFLCPETGARCLKLYLHNGYFVSRGAVTGACYSQQTESKRQRVNGMCIRKLMKNDKIIREAKKPYHKIFYNDRLTKRHRKIIKSAKVLEGLSY